MDENGEKLHLIIHGHFYQPPRENPWTQKIDRQAGAAPYHDWNERIANECYLPNARSRRLDGYGRILKLVNNYENISFNFGPTLLSWIEREYPALMQMIVDADRVSVDRNGGHGNAIAQVYNHIIMPLAPRRDQETQIRWGIYDFERRFGRKPEGIWLAETAVNDQTLEILIDFGFRFIILSPTQAERIRPLEGKAAWKNVTDGAIPTGSVYRCFGGRCRGKRNPDRYIAIFFYDASLSTDVSFNHMLRNGDSFADAILRSFEHGGGDLVTIATDGEIYGHHEPFADMALAYLADIAAPSRNIIMTNFGAYLDSHPPLFEVQLKQGKNKEGTAWSCSHGVGRWKENCGCKTGGPADWNQEWRAPLRNALDGLSAALGSIFEKEGGELLRDPWAARDDYIKLIMSRSIESAHGFMKEHEREGSAEGAMPRALSLLESQRNALLMFTSCGWFFNDISGIESVQLLEYAAKAIDLCCGKEPGIVEEDFLRILREAKSNVPESGTGEDLYLNARKYSSVTDSFLAAQYALATHISFPAISPAALGYRFEPSDLFEKTLDGISIKIGSFEMTSPFTLERSNYQYMLILGIPTRITCLLKRNPDPSEYRSMKEKFDAMQPGVDRSNFFGSAVEHFGGQVFSLRDLLHDDREKILEKLAGDKMESVTDHYETLYAESRDLLRLFSETALAPPPGLLVPAQTVMARRLARELEKWEKTTDTGGLEGIKKIVSEASYYGVPLDKSTVSSLFGEMILEKTGQLAEKIDAGLSDHLHEFVEFSAGIGIEIPMHRIQNLIFDILETRVEEALAGPGGGGAIERGAVSDISGFLRLARRFNFNTDRWQERLPGNAGPVV